MSKRNIFKTIGASNYGVGEREVNDFYATDPIAIDRLESKFSIPQYVWECACGSGCLSERLIVHGHDVVSTDLIDRGYGRSGVDFLSDNETVLEISSELRRRRSNGEDVAILTNPPFALCTEFVLRGLDLLPDGGYLIYLMRTLCLEGKERYEKIYRIYRPGGIYQMVGRLLCAKNGDFSGSSSLLGKGAQAYAWYVWKKGVTRGTVIDWI